MYSFVKNGLVPEAVNEMELVQHIKNIAPNKKFVPEKIQYYDATIDTPDEGHSHKLVIQGIQNHLTQNQTSI